MAVNLDALFLNIIRVFQREHLLKGVRMYVEHPENRIIIEPYDDQQQNTYDYPQDYNYEPNEFLVPQNPQNNYEEYFDQKPSFEEITQISNNHRRTRRNQTRDFVGRGGLSNADEVLHEMEEGEGDDDDAVQTDDEVKPAGGNTSPPSSNHAQIKQEPEFIRTEEFLAERRRVLSNSKPPNIEDVIVVEGEEEDPKPFKCNLCDYAAKKKTTLRLHFVIHTGETPYKCRHCEKRFNNPGSRRRHEFIHTGGDRKKCVLCGREVKNMKLHLLKVHDRVQCKKCLKLLLNKHQLDLHMARHDPNDKKFREVDDVKGAKVGVRK